MISEKITNGVIETDVLVVGGGIAGCCAAVVAKEKGLNVTLIEKSAIERSGSAGAGIDHFGAMTPRDGMTTWDLLKLDERWQRAHTAGRHRDLNMVYQMMRRAHWCVSEMDRIGVTMKWSDGEYMWLPWPRLGPPARRVSLRVHWQNVKPELAKAVRQRKVNVLDRVMIVDLLTNKGTVVGATALNTRTSEFIVIRAKATIIATGTPCRIFDPENPNQGKSMMVYHFCPSGGSGDGTAAVYRAGGKLANMELNCWTSRMRDDKAISFGNFRLNDGIPMKCLTWDGEEIINPTAPVYRELESKGKTPVYYSLEHLPDEYQKRIEVAYGDERPLSFKLAEDRKFNPRTHRYELNVKATNLTYWQGIMVNENFEGTLKNMYAIGDCACGMGGCSMATFSGLILGERMDKIIKEIGKPVVDKEQVESQKETALAPLHVIDGIEPSEMEVAIRYNVERYVGLLRSEGKLLEGIRRLRTFRKNGLNKLSAIDPHQHMRALEVRNILEIAQIHAAASLERKETRGGFFRVDYPDSDPELENRCTFQWLENGKPMLVWGEMPTLKPEYEKAAQTIVEPEYEKETK